MTGLLGNYKHPYSARNFAALKWQSRKTKFMQLGLSVDVLLGNASIKLQMKEFYFL